MNLTCAICADLFSSSDQLFATTCGHIFHHHCLMQWLGRSQTCPECRSRCNSSSIIRLYSNCSLNDSTCDLGSVLNKVDTLKCSVREKEHIISDKVKENEALKLQVVTLQKTSKLAKQTIQSLEHSLETDKILIQNYKDKIRALTTENKQIDDLLRQVKEKNKQLTLLENVQNIVKKSASEIEEMMKTENCRKSLATMVVTLKRELRSSENKRTDVKNTLKVCQDENRKSTHAKKEYELKIAILESEINALEQQVNAQRSLADRKNVLKDKNTVDSVIEIINSSIESIQTVPSPYLKIKSSGVGLAPLLNDPLKRSRPLQRLDSTNYVTNKKLNFNILKKPRLVNPLASSLAITKK